jgi:uncharacterized membrane protein YczE
MRTLTALEVAFVVIGWSLRRTLGTGTALFAFGIGSSVAIGILGMQNIFSHQKASAGSKK